jgi:hypothetical protein
MSFAALSRKRESSGLSGPSAFPKAFPGDSRADELKGSPARAAERDPDRVTDGAHWSLSTMSIGATSREKSGHGVRLQLRPAEESAPLDRSNARSYGVRETLDSPGQPLHESVRPFMESRFGLDFSAVRVHTDSRAATSAKALNARAYTAGSHLVFADGQYNPGSESGRTLLAHELTHVVQQGGRSASVGSRGVELDSSDAREAESDRVANAVARSPIDDRRSLRKPSFGMIEPGTLQRKIGMRDVGKGEQSGFARVPELVTRLNAMSKGLTFSVADGELKYVAKEGGTLSNFDTQMQGFIDQAAILPLRFTNRHGLLGDKAHGFHDRVLEDAWSSGYVDIDDLLASTDLGLQTVLVHFLQERSSTKNYAQRIGTATLDTDVPEHQAEFDKAHAKGIDAEVKVLQDFFGDPTIKFVPGADSGQIARVFRNSRKDTIRTRVREGKGKETGVDAVSIEVVTRDGKVHTPEEYKAILDAARAAPAAAPAAPAAAAPAPAAR